MVREKHPNIPRGAPGSPFEPLRTRPAQVRRPLRSFPTNGFASSNGEGPRSFIVDIANTLELTRVFRRDEPCAPSAVGGLLPSATAQAHHLLHCLVDSVRIGDSRALAAPALPRRAPPVDTPCEVALMPVIARSLSNPFGQLAEQTHAVTPRLET